MRKFLFILLLASVFTSVAAQQWVNFSGSNPGVPEVNVLTSNNRSVSFEVTIPGIYATDTIVDGTAFTRLILPGAVAVNSAGSPEIPVLTYKIAIPNCDGVNVAYNVVSQQNMPSCWVYPVPQIVCEQNSADCWEYVEQFTFNPDAYAQPRVPEPAAVVSSDGSLRAQRYVEILVQPVEFCPVTRQLSVIDRIEITLDFTSPQEDIRKNTGIFNKVAANAFINYEDDGISALANDRAFLKAGFTPGNIQYITLTDTAQACQIAADYLIITVPEFFNPNDPNSQITRLANHRAHYNGFDVAILNVADILPLDFEYENPDPTYKKEQRVRTCIRRIYEGKNAQHTGDSCLAYVLLVGDNYANNTGMPTSYDHDVWYNMGIEKYASDYYFSCITKESGIYDNEGDLFIGRLSVRNTADLFNMVQKTISHEINYSSEPWRTTVGFTNGYLRDTEPYYTQYVNFVKDLLDEIEWDYHFVAKEPIRVPTLNYLNEGVVYTQYMGNTNACALVPSPNTWEDDLTVDTIALKLHNGYRAPFITSIPNNSGQFDKNVECFAEFITRYDSIKGAVGYIGASRYTQSDFGYINNYLYFYKCFPYYLFGENTSIAGELLLTSQIAAHNVLPNFNKYVKYAYNLFGDPALNIIVEGCESFLTEPEYVINGQTKIVTCDTYCTENASIIVQPGGKLIVDGATIINMNGEGRWQGITVMSAGNDIGSVELINGATIENAETGIHSIGGGLIESADAHFINNKIAVQIDPVAVDQPEDLANFNNTQFVINDNFLNDPHDFDSHIKISGSVSRKIMVEGCSFSNENGYITTINNAFKNIGIKSFNSSLAVQSYNNVPTTFSGFSIGIVANNSGVTPSLLVRDNDFSDNAHDVWINAINYSDIMNNDFANSFVPALGGLSVTNSTGYNIAGNHFTNQATGIRITNSGEAENVVYNNNFSNINIGILAADKNSSQKNTPAQPAAPVTGLQFLCNSFENIQQFDIFIGDKSNLFLDHSVRRNQGSFQQPAGNRFIQNQPPRVNAGNYSNYRINYYYSSGIQEENPVYVAGLVNKNPLNILSDCPSKGFGKRNENIENVLAQYDEWNMQYEYWLDKLLAYNGGKEGEYNMLVDMVSYYSGLKDNYFNSILVAAMNDEEKGKREYLRYLFLYRGNYTDYLSIAETYLTESNYGEATAILAKMYQQFEVDEEQVSEIKGLEAYTNQLQQWEKEEKDIYSLSDKEIKYLVNYAETNTGRGTVFAKNILCVLYGICLEDEAPEYTPSKNQTEETNTEAIIKNALQINDKELLNAISVIPNPTTGELRIKDDGLRIENVEIFDLLGKKQPVQFPSFGGTGSVIDISGLPDGVYFIKIATKQGETVKKVVKQ